MKRLNFNNIELKETLEFKYCIENVGNVEQAILLPELYIAERRVPELEYVKLDVLEKESLGVIRAKSKGCATLSVDQTNSPIQNIHGGIEYKIKFVAKPTDRLLSFIFIDQNEFESSKEQFLFIEYQIGNTDDL